MFTEQDRQQFTLLGISTDTVKSQIERFKKGVKPVKLNRPCTKGDGITVIPDKQHDALIRRYSNAVLEGRTMKFVPASGAASRMFHALEAIYRSMDEGLSPEAEHKLHSFMENLDRLPFYEELNRALEPNGSQLNGGDTKAVLRYLLTDKGLNYGNLPKGSIPFHRYDNHHRSAFEEHLIEAAEYTLDKYKTARVHFTLSETHREKVESVLDSVRSRRARTGIGLQITLSTQKKSTDTIAVDLENRPFRNQDGEIVFRPGGHGALLKNLNELNADVVFIKNIDNVAPDHRKIPNSHYKKLLGGYLVKLQAQIFSYLELLDCGGLTEPLLEEMEDFSAKALGIVPPISPQKTSLEQRRTFLYERLNRPLRVCGMVPARDEPGGAPFWVDHEDGSQSLQIVEKSQVDPDAQQEIWRASTHFNPVDIVCGLRDYRGKQFDLTHYADLEAYFISRKFCEGKELKALEWPGLWNGAMALWNTVFVEVPLSTFNPVKTVFDLLRKEHQPASQEKVLTPT